MGEPGVERGAGVVLAPTWFVTDSPAIRVDAAMYSPGAFIRHGAVPDPLELDARGGERFDWMGRRTRPSSGSTG